MAWERSTVESTEDRVEVSTRRVNAAASLLAGHRDDVLRVLDRLEPRSLAAVGDAIQHLQRRRAIAEGDHDHIIDEAFDQGFGGDGLGHVPWVQGSVIVCPGAIISRSRASHRCRFVSVNDEWVWESRELMREDKRSTPGTQDGFRAVALLPVLEGMELDVVSGKARGGLHQVEKVISFKVKRGKLVEVAQRTVKPSGMK